MYKHIIENKNININKLHDELINITEPFSLLHNDDEITLLFKDIKQDIKR